MEVRFITLFHVVFNVCFFLTGRFSWSSPLQCANHPVGPWQCCRPIWWSRYWVAWCKKQWTHKWTAKKLISTIKLIKVSQFQGWWYQCWRCPRDKLDDTEEVFPMCDTQELYNNIAWGRKRLLSHCFIAAGSPNRTKIDSIKRPSGNPIVSCTWCIPQAGISL